MTKKKDDTKGIPKRVHFRNDSSEAEVKPINITGQDVLDTISAWRITINPLINSLASQAQTLLHSVKHVEELCPPEHKDDKEAIEDINAAIQKIVNVVDRLRKLT